MLCKFSSIHTGRLQQNCEVLKHLSLAEKYWKWPWITHLDIQICYYAGFYSTLKDQVWANGAFFKNDSEDRELSVLDL